MTIVYLKPLVKLYRNWSLSYQHWKTSWTSLYPWVLSLSLVICMFKTSFFLNFDEYCSRILFIIIIIFVAKYRNRFGFLFACTSIYLSVFSVCIWCLLIHSFTIYPFFILYSPWRIAYRSWGFIVLPDSNKISF